MERRSDQLRRTHRRVLGWSLGVALVLHAGTLWFAPAFRGELPGPTSDRPGVSASVNGGAVWIDVAFGPPTILLADGGKRQEPLDRTLEARGVNISGISLESECEWVRRTDLTGHRATVKLRVREDGRATVDEVTDGSGHPCVDDVIVAVAGTLWYRWLPDAQAPAPVELLQPLELTASM